MTRSLRRRYSAAREGGIRESRALRDRGEGHGRRWRPGSAGAEGLPGVWGAERSDSDDGNWGGPPWPGNLRMVLPERGVL